VTRPLGFQSASLFLWLPHSPPLNPAAVTIEDVYTALRTVAFHGDDVWKTYFNNETGTTQVAHGTEAFCVK